MNADLVICSGRVVDPLLGIAQTVNVVIPGGRVTDLDVDTPPNAQRAGATSRWSTLISTHTSNRAARRWVSIPTVTR